MVSRSVLKGPGGAGLRLALCLAVVFISSWIASSIQGAGSTVHIQSVKIPTQNGQGPYRNELGNGDMRTAPEALRTVNSGLPEDLQVSVVELGRYYGDKGSRTPRVVDNERVLHPFQPYMAEATANQIEYFQAVFDWDSELGSYDQVRQWKELLGVIALIAALAAMVPMGQLLLRTWPFATLVKQAMRRYCALLLVLLLPCVGACADAAPVGDTQALPKNVLFVGNSFTYYNNSLHNHYRQLLRAAHPDGELTGYARIMTISGGHLPEHAGLPAMLSSTPWDVVVLQGHSLGPISEDTAGPFREAARRFTAQIREAGARPVFFMTWAYTGEPGMTAELDAAYSAIGRELDAEVVPVGLAFATVTEQRPDIALRVADARHPTVAGTYLAACTFFAALRGNPEGLAYDAGLGPETAAYLQRVAQKTVLAYRAREAGQ